MNFFNWIVSNYFIWMIIAIFSYIAYRTHLPDKDQMKTQAVGTIGCLLLIYRIVTFTSGFLFIISIIGQFLLRFVK